MTRAHVVALAAGAAVALAGASAFALIYPPWTWTPVAPRTLRGIGRLMTGREQLELYANSPREWTPIPAGGLPPTARRIPIRAAMRTPLVPIPQRRGYLSALTDESKAAFVATLNATRDVLRRNGRGDEDPRVVLWLWLKETAWMQAGYNYCLGNIKHAPYASRESILAPGDPHVWTTLEDVTCVFMLRDRVRSFDSYRGFDNFDQAVRSEKRLFESRHYARPRGGGPGVLDGHRQGELEGLLVAQTAQHMGGYSPGALNDVAATASKPFEKGKLTSCREYWAMGQRRAGAAWVR